MKVSIEMDIDNLGGEGMAGILLGVTVDLESHSLNRISVPMWLCVKCLMHPVIHLKISGAGY